MNAYIQKNVKGKLNLEVAKIGLNELGCFTEEVYEVLEPQVGDIFYGNVNWISNILAKLKYTHNPLGYVPEALKNFAGRRIQKIPLREAYQPGKFIKPIETHQKSIQWICNQERDGFSINHA